MIGYGQLLLAISILVLLHELGHFIPAKIFKMRVLKFYLFFDPWFSVVKKKIGETEYGIGWLPLGGYVRVAGMIDESMDKDQMKLPAQPWEYRSKPAWQRLIMILGGITVNIILAFFIFTGIFKYYGTEYLPVTNLKYGIYADSLMKTVGFENGDKILKINGNSVTDDMTLGDVSWKILMKEAQSITVDRNGVEKAISIPKDIDNKVLGKDKPTLLMEAFPFIVDSLPKDGNAKKAGILKGDQIVGIDSIRTNSFFEFKEAIDKYKNKKTEFTIIRNGNEQKIQCQVSPEGTIGIMPLGDTKKIFDTKIQTYTWGEAISQGAVTTIDMFGKTVSQLKLLFNKNGFKHMGSVLSMKDEYGDVWIWEHFWYLTAGLSLILAFMNLLPIPGLDGGHAVFEIYEIITRRKPSQKVKETAQIIGMVFLLSLMFFAIGNDIIKGKY
jgi:regulator of sigma E protease